MNVELLSVFRNAALLCIDHLRDGGKLSLDVMLSVLIAGRLFPDVSAALKDALDA